MYYLNLLCKIKKKRQFKKKELPETNKNNRQKNSKLI